MTAGWILQANPSRFNVDDALRELKHLHWRVPQHTSQIQVGDPVVMWRSGQEAGVIGVGVVESPPSEIADTPEEARFNLGDEEGSLTTRVRVAVRPAPFISKAEIEQIAILSGHQIVTAPMGTVFPLSQEQWEALAQRLPQVPDASASSDEPALPSPFAWSDRYKSVHPLPGGGTAYLETLNAILRRVEEAQPESEELIRWLAEQQGVGERRARLTVGFLQRLSLLRSSAARVSLTDHGNRWLLEQDQLYLLALVHSRIRYVGEFLAHLVEAPRSPEELLRDANDRYAAGWSTRAQIDRRRQLLGGLGVIARAEDGGLALTESGQRALTLLELHPPFDEDRNVVSATNEAPTVEQPSRQEQSEVEGIVDELTRASHDSTHPDALEIAARDAFAFLGFEAEWLGGAGKTDVLLIAELGPTDAFRVIIDTKSTSHAAVSDTQIDWVTLEDHRRFYDADYMAVLAPAFQGTRVIERAADRDIALLDVPAMISLVRQHAEAPLGLDDYRHVFQRDSGVESVAELADELRRRLVLAGKLLRLLEELQAEEGALQASDLYWNMKSGTEEQFDPPTREEIAATLEVLASPPFDLVRRVGDGYLALGSHATLIRRLEVFISLLA